MCSEIYSEADTKYTVNRRKFMITFLTSSPTGDLDGKYRVDGIDNRNGFLDTLRRYWREDSRCLIASACPEDRENNEGFAAFWAQA